MFSATSSSFQEDQDFDQVSIKVPELYPNHSKNALPQSGLKGLVFFEHSKSIQKAKIWNIDVKKISDHIKIKKKIPEASQEPQASSKDPNQDLKDMDVL